MRARSRARAWALQVLYAWESRGADGSPLALLREFEEERHIAPASREYLRDLLVVVAEHRREVDAQLAEALTNWRLERLSVIDRNILRIAAAEILFIPDVPPRASIQEAIVLAEKFATAESPRFVNGVLDALLHRAERGGERAPGPGRPRGPEGGSR
ncbi:MAG TPA: transcription antitermination factor NusB [Longimicrobiales bacterium]